MVINEQKSVIFNSRDELLRVKIDTIVYFEADGNYTYVVTKNKLKGVLGMSLIKIEQTLTQQFGKEARMFMRVGKRFIVNYEYVYSINIGKQRLVLSDLERFAYQLQVSKEALRCMKNLLTKKKV
jgi:DNA-binding LytR/AlgR family response regulator